MQPDVATLATGMSLPRLIVNADDFGYTVGVNQAIVELHRAGAVSSATLMARGSALEDAVASLPLPSGRFTAAEALGVGCHVVLVDGTPVLPLDDLPTLSGLAPMLPAAKLDASTSAFHARFRPTLSSFVADLLRGRILEMEVEREAVAQIRLLQARGVHVTHLDTHKHTHMFPRVLRPLLRAALQCGVKAIRNPFEPAWSIRATPGAPLLRRAEVRLLTLLRPEFKRLVAQAGLKTTDGAIGVLATGTLDGQTLEHLLRAGLIEAAGSRPDKVWELVCHPGYDDDALRAQPTRLLAARETERAALLGAGAALNSFQLIHFGDLP